MSTPLSSAHPTPLAMRCPKCAAEMVTYERSGIHVDQCRECRGIFLDRGELERLVDAESAGAGWAGPSMRPAAPIPLPSPGDPRSDQRRDPYLDPRVDRRDDYRPEWFGGDDDWDGDDRDDRRRSDGREAAPRKRRSLLGELLEGLGD
jgi:Zn-finger nucleic acid-binding protein